MKNVWFIVSLLLLSIVGCTKEPPGTVVAKVGDAVLTLEELTARLDTTRSAGGDNVRSYITHWINEELLYQEALRRGIDKTGLFQTQLKNIQRQLASQLFVDQYVYSDTTEFTDSIMREYFENKRSEFVIREDIAELNIALFVSREGATWFAAQVSRGNSWRETVTAILQDSALAPGLIGNVQKQLYTQRSLFPEAIWKLAATLNTDEVSFPVKTALGYSVVQLLARKRKGEAAEFSFVRDEVHERMTMEHRRRLYTELLNDVRSKQNVEIFLHTIKKTDTTQMVSHE